jgi:hypothetical protein
VSTEMVFEIGDRFPLRGHGQHRTRSNARG